MKEPIIHAGRIECAPANAPDRDEYVDAYRIYLPIETVGKRYSVFASRNGEIVAIPYDPFRVFVRTPLGYVYLGTHRAVYPEPRLCGDGAVITIRDPLLPDDDGGNGSFLIPRPRGVETLICWVDDADGTNTPGYVITQYRG